MKPANNTEETELEYYERMREELPKHPPPLLSHAMAYVNSQIERLKKEDIVDEQRKDLCSL